MPVTDSPGGGGGVRTVRLDPQVVRKAQRGHCYWSVAMDTIVPEVGTVGFFPLQGRVVAVLTDMGRLGEVPLVPWLLEYNSLEGVG